MLAEDRYRFLIELDISFFENDFPDVELRKVVASAVSDAAKKILAGKQQGIVDAPTNTARTRQVGVFFVKEIPIDLPVNVVKLQDI